MTTVSHTKHNLATAVRSIAVRQAKPFANPYLAGILLGILLFLAFLLTGNGLGASGGMNRLLVFLESVVAPDYVAQMPYLIDINGNNANPLDSWVVFVTLGVIVGGVISGWQNGRLKVEVNRGPRVSVKTRLLMAFIGGALMGYGARLARGCTSGQALSGGAVLSVGSWALMLAIFAGGYALAYFVRRLWN